MPARKKTTKKPAKKATPKNPTDPNLLARAVMEAAIGGSFLSDKQPPKPKKTRKTS